MESDVECMREALEVAREGILQGQTPFGAVIVQDGEVIAREHNRVWADQDITAHAEVNAIRAANEKLGVDLTGCTIYSTTEPCPMCFTAIHWARIKRLVYGARISDAREAGFNELTVSNEKLKAEGGSPVELVGGVLEDECRRLFTLWKEQGGETY